MARALVVVLLCVGCGGRCKDVATARAHLTSRHGAANRGPDVEVIVPLARANALIAELVQQQPLSVPLELPALVKLGVAVPPLTATVTGLVLEPGAPGRLRFVAHVSIADGEREVTTLIAKAEVEPVVTPTELSLALGPKNILELRPELGADASAKLGAAVTRWLPDRAQGALPQGLIDLAAAKLGSHLTGVAWSVLQKTLLVKLGEVTSLRVRLPDVPIDHVDVHSQRDALVVDIASSLPIRAGLAPLTWSSSEIAMRIAGSAAAELANWALDRRYVPSWYDRGLKPTPDGEFRPRFDYVPGASHPFKIYSFQERGGCSYLEIGVAATLGMSGAKLVVAITDQALEAIVRQSADRSRCVGKVLHHRSDRRIEESRRAQPSSGSVRRRSKHP